MAASGYYHGNMSERFHPESAGLNDSFRNTVVEKYLYPDAVSFRIFRSE